MPNMPTPQKHQWGRHPPRRGKESATPFYPDAGRIAPIYARVLSLSLMSAFTPRSSFRCPSPWRPIQTPHCPELRPFEVLAVIEPSRMCCSMQSCITVPSGRIYVFFIVFLYIIMCYFTTTFWPFTMYTPFVRCFKSPLTRTPCRL